MGTARFVNIIRLMTSYDFEIEELPDNLRCAKCKLVLKDAQLVSCGCTFCRVCIDDMVVTGSQFCPGNTEHCRDALLSSVAPDYRANKSVSRLTVKCVHGECMHKCLLVDMEEHLQQCPRKTTEGSVNESFNEKGDHFTEESRGDSNEEMESPGMRDEQISTLVDQMIHVENEIKSIKNDIESMKEEINLLRVENANLSTQVVLLTEKLDKEIKDRRQADIAQINSVAGHVDQKFAAIKAKMETDMKDFHQRIDGVYIYFRSVETLVGLGQVDARHEWLINENIHMTSWSWRDKRSENFIGTQNQYIYHMSSDNCTSSLAVWLCINSGPNDNELPWPFEGRVVIKIADTNLPELNKSVSQQCRIYRPANNSNRQSTRFQFEHLHLKGAGLDLSRGVRVTCLIDLD